MAEAKVDYVESPLDRIVGVHWGAGAPMSLMVDWLSDMIETDALFDAGTVTVMNVRPVNLPPLSKTTLSVNPGFLPPEGGLPPQIDLDSLFDQVSGSFPDGPTGIISGQYFMRQLLFTGRLTGFVQYSTTATSNSFHGVSFIAISQTIDLRPLFRGSGYHWQASASLSGGSAPLTLSGTAASGSSISFTAMADLRPPSLSFGIGVSAPSEVPASPRLQRLRARGILV